MVAGNYKIKVPGVMKNHTLNVHAPEVLKMMETYDKRISMTSLMLFFLSYYYQMFLVLIYHHKISIDFNIVEYI